MTQHRKLWLITNDSSGSNDAAAHDAIETSCNSSNFSIAGRTRFPADPLPTPEGLDEAKVDLLAIFAGDGTLNSAIGAVAGWRGSVLVLPGGTMNLLYHRLFGELTMEEALIAVGNGSAQPRRPGIVKCPMGEAYAGTLVGPGTAWNDVREAMRAGDLVDLATDAQAALAETLSGEAVACYDPPLGRDEGYPLLMLTPQDDAIELVAYHSETPLDYLKQAAALVLRDFRQGPHEVLGRGESFTIGGPAGRGFGVLLDGEPVHADKPVQFTLARIDVDLLAILPNG